MGDLATSCRGVEAVDAAAGLGGGAIAGEDWLGKLLRASLASLVSLTSLTSLASLASRASLGPVGGGPLRAAGPRGGDFAGVKVEVVSTGARTGLLSLVDRTWDDLERGRGGFGD
jgi:hypothetical protein